MSLTTTKTIVQGKEQYVMEFVGAHNTGPTLEFKPGNSGLIPPRVYPESLTHGSATDIWKVSIRPDAVGLLVFGVARVRLKRN